MNVQGAHAWPAVSNMASYTDGHVQHCCETDPQLVARLSIERSEACRACRCVRSGYRARLRAGDTGPV